MAAGRRKDSGVIRFLRAKLRDLPDYRDSCDVERGQVFRPRIFRIAITFVATILRLPVNAAILNGHHVEEPYTGMKGSGIPIRRSAYGGTTLHSRLGGPVRRKRLGLAVGADSARPIHFPDKRFAKQ